MGFERRKFFAGLYDGLSLHIRHFAWLNAIIERPKESKAIDPQQSRLTRMRNFREDAEYHPGMPDPGAGVYLLGVLFELGPTMAGAMGSGPLTHGEIEAWQRNTGIDLQPWEARFLRSLSVDYITGFQAAEKAGCKAPWTLPNEE